LRSKIKLDAGEFRRGEEERTYREGLAAADMLCGCACGDEVGKYVEFEEGVVCDCGPGDMDLGIAFEGVAVVADGGSILVTGPEGGDIVVETASVSPLLL
jgi:hypothetical protein